MPPLAAQILINRGLATHEEADTFLYPDYRELADPFLMKGMGVATERVIRALNLGERITVYGDFDADGVTSVTLLVQTLRQMGGLVEPYIPHRIEEGYGLHLGAVEQLAQDGTQLLITVDCGISNSVEVARANELGLDVIVTDHHLPLAELPPALAILNPRQVDCAYPFKRLAGVGIAFTLVRGLVKAGAPRHGLRGRDLLDLVALGTVTDVSALIGENRILVAYGLEAMGRTERPGLRALMAVSEAKPDRISTGTIGFVLGPRLNAPGRLRHASTAYRLLLAETREEAAVLAREVDDLNRERQDLSAQILERAREQVLEMPELVPLIFLSDPHFPAGVVGLVAGKLTEEFHRPTLLVEVGEAESRGSARSIGPFHIADALSQCSDLLVRFGGHRLAAGFTVLNENLDALKFRLNDLAQHRLEPSCFIPELRIDAATQLSTLNWELIEILERMAPFGIENPRPVFMCPQVKVVQAQRVGRDGRHLKMALSDGVLTYSAIAFRSGERWDECQAGSSLDVVCTLEKNIWQGKERLQLKVRDWRPAGEST
jgi:single-stranded-DNA-specific exonuclease